MVGNQINFDGLVTFIDIMHDRMPSSFVIQLSFNYNDGNVFTAVGIPR